MDPASAGLDIARLVTKRRIQDGRRFTCPDIASLSFRGYYRTAVSKKCDSRDRTQVEFFQDVSFQTLRPRLEIFVAMEFGDSPPFLFFAFLANFVLEILRLTCNGVECLDTLYREIFSLMKKQLQYF